MPGWVPFDADGWPEVAEALSSTGRPWPTGAAAFDLRWHTDQARRELPTDRQPTIRHHTGHGRPYFADRWGWTDHKVKKLIRSGEWMDPKSPVRRQSIASPSPVDHQPAPGETPDTDEKPPTDRQFVTSSSPVDRLTRVDPHSHSQPPPQKDPPLPPRGGLSGDGIQGGGASRGTSPASTSDAQRTDGGAPAGERPPSTRTPSLDAQPDVSPEDTPPDDTGPDDWDRVVEAWSVHCLKAMGRKRSGRIRRSSPTGERLTRELKKHGLERVLASLRFIAYSQHWLAVKNRNNRCDLLTPLRHVDRYADWWEEFGKGGAPRSDQTANGFHLPAAEPEPEPDEPTAEEQRWLAEAKRISAEREAERAAWLAAQEAPPAPPEAPTAPQAPLPDPMVALETARARRAARRTT